MKLGTATITAVNGKPVGSKPLRLARVKELVEPATTIRLTLTLPIVSVSEANNRQHWVAKRRRAIAQQQAVTVALKNNVLTVAWCADKPLTVELVRIGGKMLDDDNLHSAFKATRDAIAAFFGRDDGSELWTWKYDQEPGPQPQGVRIVIEG